MHLFALAEDGLSGATHSLLLAFPSSRKIVFNLFKDTVGYTTKFDFRCQNPVRQLYPHCIQPQGVWFITCVGPSSLSSQ